MPLIPKHHRVLGGAGSLRRLLTVHTPVALALPSPSRRWIAQPRVRFASAVGAADVSEDAVLSVLEDHITPRPAKDDGVFADLELKCRVLSACELKFGLAIPHADLNGIVSPQDLVHYFEARRERRLAEQRKEAQHWTRKLPSNVTLDLGRNRRQQMLEAEPEDDHDDEDDADGDREASEHLEDRPQRLN